MMDRFAKPARRALLLLAALAPLGGCALADIGSGPAPSLYVLTAPAVEPAPSAPQSPVQLVVEEFSAPAAVDTTRIVFMQSENQIAYYAGARWSDRAPRMIASLLVETLSGTGSFPAVIGPDASARMDQALVGDIRSFSAYRPSDAGFGEGGTKVRVELFVRLLRARDRTILASRAFSAEAASGGGMDGVVAAYDEALDVVLADIAAWTLEQSLAAGEGS